MSTDIDTLVIGAGVVGLAVARRFAQSNHTVVIIEQENAIGTGISSRNSEVIHAGIYNPPNSLKSRLCIRGKELLYDYVSSHNIPFKRCGKLIVATEEVQDNKLEEIESRAKKNGVEDLVFLDKKEATKMEPELFCSSALYSPSTGIIDTHQFMLSLLGQSENNGASIAYNSKFIGATPTANGFKVTISLMDDEIISLTCRNLINCSGLSAQTLASSIEGMAPSFIPKLYFVKGNYFSMTGNCPFRHLIYPVPEAGGLGVHLTLDMNGQARFGPDVESVDELNYEVTIKNAQTFFKNARKFYPKLKQGSLLPAYSGIRPKLSPPEGVVEDFVIQGSDIHNIGGLVNLFGIESPGMTSSLAIADHVYDLIC